MECSDWCQEALEQTGADFFGQILVTRFWRPNLGWLSKNSTMVGDSCENIKGKQQPNLEVERGGSL